jgi:hypothetical protein
MQDQAEGRELKMASETVRIPQGSKKGPEIAGFLASNSDWWNLSEFIRIPGHRPMVLDPL